MVLVDEVVREHLTSPKLAGIRLSSGAVLLDSRTMPVLILAKQGLPPLSKSVGSGRAEVSYVRATGSNQPSLLQAWCELPR